MYKKRKRGKGFLYAKRRVVEEGKEEDKDAESAHEPNERTLGWIRKEKSASAAFSFFRGISPPKRGTHKRGKQEGEGDPCLYRGGGGWGRGSRTGAREQFCTVAEKSTHLVSPNRLLCMPLFVPLFRS